VRVHSTPRTAYLYDQSLHDEANAAGRNYWYAYVREILDRVGVAADEVPPASLADADALARYSTLILPDLEGGTLSAPAVEALGAWVERGGQLLSFGSHGPDALFGLVWDGRFEQSGDEFAVSAAMRWQQHPLTAGVLWPLHSDAPAPIISRRVRLMRPVEAEVLAELCRPDGTPLDCAAVSVREVGEGRAVYFAFNVAQTMWVLQQGRPVDADYDGDGYFRLSDARAAPDFEPEVPFADQLLFLLRDLLAGSGEVLVHPLPPQPETHEVPDALFFWGGDDEAAGGTQLWASNWVREQGLPYHINIMPLKDGTFTVTREEYEAIKANGHEPSLHLDFQSGFAHPYAYSEAEVRQQVEWYVQAYGELPVCSVFHWTHWTGWHEPAEWLLRAGAKADNSRIHRGSPPLNPANMLGYSFGTSFPYRFYTDHRSGNRPLEFLSEPITAYECGYNAGQGTEFSALHRAINLAAQFHLTTDLFFHPINVYNHPECREAIQEVLRYTGEQGISALHMGNDELALWWFARSASRVRDVRRADDGLSFAVDTPWEHGCVVVADVPGEVEEVQGAASRLVREEFGRRRLYVACPTGRTGVEVRFG